MSESSKRCTIHFEPEIHQALRLKSAVTHRSVSELVNEVSVGSAVYRAR
jgi:hypothetical protein